MALKDQYLILYNASCAGGWAAVWFQSMMVVVPALVAASSLADVQEALASVYTTGGLDFSWVLTISQCAAVLEIVHSAVGIVRSPVMVTAMQVSSRLLALQALLFSSDAQAKWGNGTMIIAWASVEVPRYLFYVAAIVTGDATKKTPYPLFWLRYSLFAVLYPMGITGELNVMTTAAQDPAFVEALGDTLGSVWAWIYSTAIPIIYFFGSPFMIFNMYMNRKSAFKKRYAKPPPPPQGLCWPVDSKGERSSTKVNQAILAAAVGAVNESKAEAILKCKGWRFKYWRHLKSLVEEQCTSPEAALKIAEAGLDKAYELFEFVNPEDKSAISFKEAMSKPADKKFYTMEIKGTGTGRVEKLEVPYKGETLSGQKLKDQVKKWVDYGTIEPSAGEAITKCVDHPEWIKQNPKHSFVLLGAGSAMGPLLVLLSIGANVVAVDLDRPGIWKRLIGLAKNSTGSITFPLKVDPATIDTNDMDQVYAQAGCNLFTNTPMIRDWLLNVHPDHSFTVGSYAYLNGALHVQVSLAMDAICRDLSEKRKNVSLAYLCTPTDLHLQTKESYDAAAANYKEYSGKLYCIVMSLLGNGKFLRKNVSKPVPGKGGDFFIVNGISVAQGPNYALAKRMQHWRAIVARSKGCTVSSNIAPSTSTVSVVQNRTFAWAYEGMPYFRPMEIFAPETSNAVMSAILIFDINDPASVGNPKNAVANPNQLFSYGSFHGGVWRCPYELDSIGEASVFLYFGRLGQPYFMGAVALGVAAAGVYFGTN